jgi:cellulose biosynthesis protein BcsQ
MAKIICLFNHKGGVSKTTTTFNLGWMMANKGKRVLLADFDPRCNLTGMVMGFKGVDDLAAIYSVNPPNNVKDGLAPAFESQPRGIVPVECVEVAGNDNSFLLPGHIGLAEYETTLGIAQELSGSLLALRNALAAMSLATCREGNEPPAYVVNNPYHLADWRQAADLRALNEARAMAEMDDAAILSERRPWASAIR